MRSEAIRLTSLRLPDGVHAQAQHSADVLGVSLNDYYVEAIRAYTAQAQLAIPLPVPVLPVSAGERDPDAAAVQRALTASHRQIGGRGKQATLLMAFGTTMRPDAYALLTRLRRQTRLSKGVLLEAGVRLLAACVSEGAADA